MKIRNIILSVALCPCALMAQAQPTWSTVPRIEYGQGVPEQKWCNASQSGTIYIDTWPQNGLGFHVFYTCDQKTTGVYVWEGPYGTGGGGSTNPGGNPGQIQFNKQGVFGGFTIGGDATLNSGNGVMTVTGTQGSPFAPSATTDTTNAGNIGSGTLGQARLPSTTVETNQSNAFATGTQDASLAQHTLPAVTGLTASKPGSCRIGELYFATDATPGQNLYFCTGLNAWTQMAAGSGSTLSWANLTSGQWASMNSIGWAGLAH